MNKDTNSICKLSLVIPVFNEEIFINQLFEETIKSLTSITDNFEIICVNDGSTDNSFQLLLQCNKKDNRFKILNLSRNFGHQAAFTAGLKYAKGEYVAMMDGDLQDPPLLLKDMYEKMLSEKLDVVYGCRKGRSEGVLKRILIILFHKIFRKLSSIKISEDTGNFSMMNRKATNAFLNLNEKNRYLPGLRHFIGFEQGYIEYERRSRNMGKAKMNYRKLFKLAMDAIFSFSKIPIKICLIAGIIGIIFTLSGGVIVFAKKIMGDAITGWTSTMLSIFFLGSVQLLFMGIIGEYVHRIFVESQNRPVYIVKDFIE